MENPFYRNFVKSRPRFFDTPAAAKAPRGVPVQQFPTATEKAPRVVSIPVHFVGSEETRSKAALRIQKVFRGHRVRKNVKRIVAIKKEVDEIEKRISLNETVDLIRDEEKERLKVNEMLMVLLFKLDSVGGFDSGVRDCRRAVTKKAIMLQERLDSIVSRDCQTLCEGEDSVVEEQAEILTQDSFVEDEVKDLSNSSLAEDVEQSEEKNVTEEEVVNKECVETVCLKGVPEENKEDDAMEVEQQPSHVTQETEEGEKEKHVGNGNGNETEKVEEEVREKGITNNIELMEKMIEKNEMLIGMVADLCERNTVQTQLISSLSKRVDNLEKALSKCKKRRKVAPKKSTPATC